MRYLIVLFLIYSCGAEKAKDPRTIRVVDNSLSSYLDLYLEQKGAPLDYDISMGFGEMDKKPG